MTVINVLQCSVCRRIKDIIQDKVRASPNQCTITKGCSGFLFKIGETTVQIPTLPVSGLTDWYPRGEKVTSIPSVITEQLINMSTSNSGGLTLALNVPISNPPTPLNPWGTSPPSNVVATFYQQLAQDIPFNEFIFNISSPTTILAGKDSTGKNLRFSLNDVQNGRVFVLVNGVASFPNPTSISGGWWTTTPNQIIFYNTLSVSAVVSVAVYSVAPISTVSLNFILNQNLTAGINFGSWSNVRWVEEYDPLTGIIKPFKWWLYTCSSVAALGKSARLKFKGIFMNASNLQVLPLLSTPTDYSAIRFLLASPPHDNADRYLNFFINANIVSNQYILITSTSKVTELSVDQLALTEFYPPFQLIESANLSTSFITSDTILTNNLASMTETRFKGKKIIGPQ